MHELYDGRLENGEFVATDSIFTQKETADKVCQFLNNKLSLESEDTFLAGGSKYYVMDYLWQRYYVHESIVYESADEYLEMKGK